MANLKEIRDRIGSVNSTKQITSAMKMVAASKLRKAQNAIVALRPYSNRFEGIMKDVAAVIDENQKNVFSTYREPEKILVLVITSNRGLCGAYNSNTLKTAVSLINDDYSEQFANGNVFVATAGKKATEFFKKYSFNVVTSLDGFIEKPCFLDISKVATEWMNAFEKGNYDKVVIVYNQFVNAATQRIQVEPWLPISAVEEHEPQVESDFIFEPNKNEIMNVLIPKTLKIQLYKSFLDAAASEQGARMTAMHQATDNATEMLKELKLHYNKARQSAITNEIIEIVSGAEALNG